MMKSSKIDESYLLLKKWWEQIKITNYEKRTLNKEIISFNQQLIRLKEKHLRIGVFGKAGVGKSSILNLIINENFFTTGILNGSTKTHRSKELTFKQRNLKTIELIDCPGFDVCAGVEHKKNVIDTNDLDLILFITAGDLNRNDVKSLNDFINNGKKVLIIFNKTDLWKEFEIENIVNNIKQKIPEYVSIPIIKNSNKFIKKQTQKCEFINYLNDSIDKFGDSLLILNTLQLAYKLSKRIKECRFLKRKKKAQAAIGKFATMKASGVALNPLLFFDIAGCFILDTALVKELSRIYGFEIKNQSAKKLLKTISVNNIFLGATQIGIGITFNLIRKISLISAPFTGGISLLPYGPVAIAQAALAVKATNIIGKLAAREILNKSKFHNLEPFQTITQIALRETKIIDTGRIFSYNPKTNRDLSIFIP